MSKKLYEESNIQGIASAIREKNGTQNQYTVSQMPAAVRAIRTQPDLEILNVTENGNYLPSAGKDGFSEVNVSVAESHNAYPKVSGRGYVDSIDNPICKLDDRNYYKYNDTPACAGYYYDGTYTCLILASTTPDGCKYTTSFGSTTQYETIEVNDDIYYVTVPFYSMYGNFTSNIGPAYKISDSILTLSEAQQILASNANTDPWIVDHNGLYEVPEGYSGFKTFNADVPASVQALTITQNGVYTPPSGVDGYSPVTVKVSGMFGFITDYTVLADETVATFDQSNQTWGNLSIGGTGAFATSDAVRFPQASTMANASYAYFDFGSTNQSATVYFVGRLYETPQYSPSNNLRMISSFYAESSRNTQEFMAKNGLVLYGQYGDSESSVTSSASAYDTHVLAMRIDQTNKKVTQFIDGVQAYDQSFNNFGQNIYFAAEPNFSQSYMSACPLEVNRIIITSGPDKTVDMLQNMLYLMGQGGDDDPFKLKNYIQSSGTQYIDTGYISNDDTEVECVANFRDIGTNTELSLFGSRMAVDYNSQYANSLPVYVNVMWMPNQSIRNIEYTLYPVTGFRTNEANNNHYGTGIPLAVKILNQDIKVRITSSTSEFKIETDEGDRFIQSLVSLGSLNANTAHLILFGVSSNGNVLISPKFTLYCFRIKENGTLLHEFLPHKDGNNVVCMRDTVTGNLFYNAGTGDFVYGTDS